MTFAPYSNPCVVCGARPFERCRTLRTGRVTDTHIRRVQGEWPGDSDGSQDVPHNNGGTE